MRKPRAGVSVVTRPVPQLDNLFRPSQITSIGLRILTQQSPRLLFPGSIKSKGHTCVWPKLLYAPRAGFEPATN